MVLLALLTYAAPLNSGVAPMRLHLNIRQLSGATFAWSEKEAIVVR